MDSKKVPAHIAVIMDGNARWARVRGMESVWGHRKGAESVRKIVRYCALQGVEYLSLFAFSTENWSRPRKEVESLMELFVEYINSQLEEMKEKEIRFLFSGRRERFSSKVKEAFTRAEKETAQLKKMKLVLCVNYGGRQELADAAIKSYREGGELPANFYIPSLPDVDLLIRTSGEQRLSNFMLWQMAYSELYFTDVLWPDFSEKDMEKALKSFSRRSRKFGKRV